MPDPSTAPPCVFVVADPARTVELVAALAEPLPTTVVSKIDVVVSAGGDDTIDLFEVKRPHVVVVTASLEDGDAAVLVDVLRDMTERREELGIVVIGDEPRTGAIRTAADAAELAPDRFVERPLAPRALRFAVASVVEAVVAARRAGAPDDLLPSPRTSAPTMSPPWPQSPSYIEKTQAEADATTPTPAPIEAKPDLRARWAALADSIVDLGEEDLSSPGTDARAMPPPITIRPRQRTQSEHPPEPALWDEPSAPTREPTLIIADDPPPPESRTRTGDGHVDLFTKGDGERWSPPLPLAELVDRDSEPSIEPPHRDSVDELGLSLHDDDDDLDDDLLDEGTLRRTSARLEVVSGIPDVATPPPTESPPTLDDGRDFARQLRAKMSQMAQRLFQGSADAPAPNPADLAPRHDHHTEIDLAALGEETPLADRGVTEFEHAPSRPAEPRDLVTSPGSWDTQVRERGLPETGEIVRGVSDAAMLLAKMFASSRTGRVQFRRDDAEKVVFFDGGRPVFAASNVARDRMGELLVREGKITAAQYERCQAVVAESGRRMGEILVDFGYLKRRELLPAVRRHVEDIVYSLFGWDRGHYHITVDEQPSGERIRLSRHPASLVLEGIRRKLDRTSLEKLIGPPSTVIEVGDRDRLNAIVNLGDLSPEERAALAAFDGQADLVAVARVAGVDVTDVLPLAWGLVVLGLATARRTEAELPEEGTALVGETDLAIDRERVRARWQLVTEADYFALLGVRRDATAFEIRRAYQSARRDFATDAFPTDLRRELAQELDDIANVLDEAFRVLRDDRLRQTYLSNLIE